MKWFSFALTDSRIVYSNERSFLIQFPEFKIWHPAKLVEYWLGDLYEVRFHEEWTFKDADTGEYLSTADVIKVFKEKGAETSIHIPERIEAKEDVTVDHSLLHD